MSRHWANIGEAGAVAGLRIMVWVDEYLGRFAFRVLLVPVMLYFFACRSTARRASLDYLQRIHNRYPESLPARPGLSLAYRHFLTFGQSLLDKFVAWVRPPTGINMDRNEEELLFELAHRDKGILLVGSHFGNLEYSRALAYRHENLIINILLYDQHAANFAALVENAAPESRLNLIQVTDLDLDVALRLKSKIQHGEWVLIAGDRVPVGDSGKVCPAEFLGDWANFPIGPYVLANLLDCPVYLLHCFSSESGYRLEIELFEETINIMRDGRNRKYDCLVQKYATALEHQVRRAPLQWYNFYDFWRESDTGQTQADSLADDDTD